MTIVYQGRIKTGKEIIIRYPEPHDVDGLLTFINALSDEHTFIRYQGEHETIESERKWLTSCLKNNSSRKSVNLLVIHDGEVVGASEIHLMDKTEKHIGILAISISQGFRGEGIGATLIDMIIKEAAKQLEDLQIVTLEVYSTNLVGKKLYQSAGFVEYGRLPEGITRNGTFEDAILMYKKVGL